MYIRALAKNTAVLGIYSIATSDATYIDSLMCTVLYLYKMYTIRCDVFVSLENQFIAIRSNSLPSVLLGSR